MTLKVWLEIMQQAAAGSGALLMTALKQAQVTVARRHDGEEDGAGIVLFAETDKELLQALPALCGHARVLAIAACGRPPSCAQQRALMAAGALDVLLWPGGAVDAGQVLARLQRWQAVAQMLASGAVRQHLVGDSAAWTALLHQVVEMAAFSQASMLITGETGTGKDLLAQLVHRLGNCRGDFTILDCTTLSPELAGSELFGHERGAFTGAAAARDGAFALADGGVLFLDEVGELPLLLQAQLLRAIQERKYKRVGGNTWQPTQFRLVCATNRELEGEVARGAFRADLYYRIAGWRCQIPPLRERQDDILPLARHFLAELAQQPPPPLDAAVREYLLLRDYPGNVRELRQTVTHIWHRHCGPGPITIGALPPEERLLAPHWPDQHFEAAVRRALAQGCTLSHITRCATDTAIRLVLADERGNNQRAAARLGVTDRALQLRRKAAACATQAATAATIAIPPAAP
ncbi:sigma-54-dependent transcriptional regulator [Janthinobacterium lividum]|uniref:Sigma 54-interacting transcriptional regulator n=1 Tax=Janthinobacterium lividum TaxID=29581 RepID=A0ABU0XPM7_9BURK|nr:sigma 54-interacting transcriptional regulator [Janthinobacterium lividum]MDQ4625108.1 sigma 54-interacting transcriptional regulator [Janthinobacterium lividum]MDQ4673289.1 sigma 54-interacting transcriptional regulator [Janthinobacterium lividum]MDQ4684019.1 sigma 54-interacting transcriptional regulator [Janthinobacterium lividum]